VFVFNAFFSKASELLRVYVAIDVKLQNRVRPQNITIAFMFDVDDI